MSQCVFVTTKHPEAKPWLMLDWSEYAGAQGGPAIAASTWNDAGSSTVTFEAPAFDNHETRVLLAGGANGEIAYVENRVTFTDGSIEVRTVVVSISDEVPGNGV